MYGIELSEGTVSNITNTIIENIKQWQQRTLESVYFVVWMDGIVIKIRNNGKVHGRTIYLVIGLRQDGLKEVQGMRISETESASFWMNALTDLMLVYRAINKEAAFSTLGEFCCEMGLKIRLCNQILEGELGRAYLIF